MKSRPFQVGRIYTDDDATILADGMRLKVPTMMRDAKANGLCDDCSGTGLYPASVRCPSCGGTGIDPANTTGDRASLSDAETQMRDHIARDQEYRRTHSGNMPGYRFVADSEERRAARQQLADAYQEYEARLTSSWKDASVFEENTARLSKPPTQEEMEQIKRMSNAGRTTAQIAQDHQARMAEETRLYENSVANAYKNLR